MYSSLFILRSLVLSASILSTSLFAATAVDLSNPSTALLSLVTNESQMKELQRDIDFNHVTHVRFQQMYQHYPVWGADIVVHVPPKISLLSTDLFANPQLSYSGVVYKGLPVDLVETPHYVFMPEQAKKALQYAYELSQHAANMKTKPSDEKSDLIVYIDKNKRAHWAYKISFSINNNDGLPMQPNYILDAVNFSTYQHWNNIQTLDGVQGGGLGGNPKMGKFIYDNLKHDYPALTMLRDASNICYLQNDSVTVRNIRKNNEVVHFDCAKPDSQHNNIYWNENFDTTNGAYSPSNDALYAGKIIKEMYEKWYGIPVLMKDDKPMMLTMVVHASMENAYWDGKEMTFGDGEYTFYPLVSLGVAAHEISHGFTEQHSNLVYDGQSGGLNESFSDMAAQAAEYFSTGKNSWQIGPEIMKGKNQALRYMDEPTKDCRKGDKPGYDCSINNIKDFHNTTDVHFSSGIFNKIFYQMSVAKDWDIKKAFDVMVQANRYYWTSTSTFKEAACGILKATNDYHYSSLAVKQAISQVGIVDTHC